MPKKQVLSYTIPKATGEKVVVVSFRTDAASNRLIKKTLRDARDKLGWLSEGELIRWCIHFGLGKLTCDLADRELVTEYALIESSYELLRASESKQRYTRLLEEARATISGLISSGADGEIRALVAKIWENLENLPSNFWTERLKKQWRTEFGEWLPKAPPTPVPVPFPGIKSEANKSNGKEQHKVSLRPRDAERDEKTIQ